MSRPSDGSPRYPLGRHHRSSLRTRTGKPLDDISLEAVREGAVAPLDLAIHGDTLRMQADVAQAAGFHQLAQNLRRAAELTGIPDEALRPNRSSYYQLLDLSEELEQSYGAAETARYVREAAEAYRVSGLLTPETD